MRTNEIVFDLVAKEFVIVSNGIPVKDKDGYETLDLIPTEGMALRVAGLTKEGKPIIAFTYRKLDSEKLSKLETPSSCQWILDFVRMEVGDSKHYRYIGRV